MGRLLPVGSTSINLIVTEDDNSSLDNKINYMQGLDIKAVEGKEKNRLDHGFSSGRHPSKVRSIISDAETVKILEEVERLLGKGDNLECINLLRALKDNMQGVKNQNLQVIVVVNLGILYYQVGFLEEAQEELTAAIVKYTFSHQG